MEKTDINSDLYKIRHSLAHVLAQAVLEIRPDAKLGFGPPIDSGFYYDFDLTEPLSPEDLPMLEKRMRQIIKKGQVFEREELGHDEMVERLDKDNQGYKIEQVEDLSAQNEILSLIVTDRFGICARDLMWIPRAISQRIVFPLIHWQVPIGKVLRKTT
jgi:threonyl-tRNA synthetase